MFARICFVASFLTCAPALAQEPELEQSTTRVEGAFDDGDPRVVTTLIVDAVSVNPLHTMRAGVQFEIDEGWHIYWMNPGQTGLATEVTFDSDGATPQMLRWPAPSVFRTAQGFITSYGYEDEVFLYAEILPDDDAEGVIVVRATADYLVCAQTCIPGRHEMELTVPVGEQLPVVGAEATFQAAWDRRARAASEWGWTLAIDAPRSVLEPGESYEIALRLDTGPEETPLGEGGPLRRDDPIEVLVPARVQQLTVSPTAVHGAPEGRRGLSIVATVTAGPDLIETNQVLDGVLLVRDSIATYPVRFSIPIPR